MRRSPVANLLLLWLVFSAVPARAVPVLFAIDPVQSPLVAAGQLTVELGLGSGPIVMPFESQAGTPGTAGGLLPNGTTSDGLVTSLGGTLAADLDLAAGTLAFSGGATIAPGPSGTWLPGAMGTATAEAGQLAVAFQDGTLGIAGEVAIRAALLSLVSSVLTLSPAGGGDLELAAGSGGFFLIGAGFLDVASNLAGVTGRAVLASSAIGADLSGGLLEDLGAGVRRLTLPFDLALSLAPEDLGAPFPLFADLQLAGTLVATTTLVPEPPRRISFLVLAAAWLVLTRSGRS